jgi:hypothetical protein
VDTQERPAAPKLNRALPSWAVDAVRFGLKGKEGHDSRRVWGMAVSIAMSAQQRGWSEQDYVNEINRHESHLWHQLKTGKKGRPTSEGTAYKALEQAWVAARDNLIDLGERTRDDIRADATELAFLWTDRLADNVDGLTDTQIAVMRYVICQTEERGMFKVTCPVRQVGEFAKVSIKTASRTLGALTDKGLLNRYSRGTHSPNGTGKASIHGLKHLTA